MYKEGNSETGSQRAARIANERDLPEEDLFPMYPLFI